MLIRLRLGQKSELSVTFNKADIRPKAKYQIVTFFITVCLGPETHLNRVYSDWNMLIRL